MSKPKILCPDGGTCHHRCVKGNCARVGLASPLPGVFEGDDWPADLIFNEALHLSNLETDGPDKLPPFFDLTSGQKHFLRLAHQQGAGEGWVRVSSAIMKGMAHPAAQSSGRQIAPPADLCQIETLPDGSGRAKFTVLGAPYAALLASTDN